MTSLVDRYVYAALRRIPEKQRADIDRELRASIADAVEARVEAGQESHAATEAALTELGDPRLLADSYVNRPQYLIGPELFAVWRRVLTTLLSTVLPVVVAVVVVIQLIEDRGVGKVIGSGISAAITTGVQMTFWTTLVFAIIERTGVGRDELEAPWTPAALPKFEPSRLTSTQLAANLVWPVMLVAALILQQFTFTDEPVLNPDNWAFWWPYLIVVFILEGAYAVLVYRLGAWTRRVAAANAVLALMFAVPVIWLLATDHFYNPAFYDRQQWGTPHPEHYLNLITIAVVGLIALWDIVDMTLRAERARRGLPAELGDTVIPPKQRA